MKLDEKAIKWIIREKEKGTPTKTIAEIENINTKESKPDLQAIQGNRSDTKAKETGKTKERAI